VVAVKDIEDVVTEVPPETLLDENNQIEYNQTTEPIKYLSKSRTKVPCPECNVEMLKSSLTRHMKTCKKKLQEEPKEELAPEPEEPIPEPENPQEEPPPKLTPKKKNGCM
jgi:hypothetical protein